MTVGILLHDVQSYARADAIRSAFGLTGDIGIQAVSPFSPAFAAGIRQNDTLLEIDGVAVDDLRSVDGDWQRTARLRDMLDRSASDGSVELSWRDASDTMQTRKISAVQACSSTIELRSDSKEAAADGKRILIGEKFAGLEYEDDELAAILAHELAHNLLGHIGSEGEDGKPVMRTRQAERQADRLMPWLLANALYDPNAAVRMINRWGPRHSGGIFRKRTHDSWQDRRDMIAEEVAMIEVERSLSENRRADWSARFNLRSGAVMDSD